MAKKKGIIRNYHLNTQMYKDTFIGSAFVDWLTKQEHITIDEAIELGRKLLDYNIIKHGELLSGIHTHRLYMYCISRNSVWGFII